MVASTSSTRRARPASTRCSRCPARTSSRVYDAAVGGKERVDAAADRRSAERDGPVRLVDTRHEQTAVFAAEATGKLTRTPGFAAVTAGPGVTNAVSAITSA